MATECPHCFRIVIPLKDGMCPACRQNVREAPTFAQGLEAIWIGEKVKLPELCCTCGESSRRTVTVSSSLNYTTKTESRSQSADDGGAARFLARILFGRLFVLLFQMFSGGGSESGDGSVRVQVKMRQCRPCSRKKPLEPQTVDYDYHKMRFVTSAKFVEAFVNVNLMTQE
jgi:hypothetical protein